MILGRVYHLTKQELTAIITYSSSEANEYEKYYKV